jgi:hypothetical protein
VNKYLIVLVDYSEGIYGVASRPKYVTDDRKTAEDAVNLMNEVANYSRFQDEDGEWFDTHFAVREVEVWGSGSA